MGKNVSIKVVIVILLLLVVTYVYYRYGLSPQLAQLRDLRDQVTQAESKLATLQEVQRLKNAFLRQNQAYTAWIKELATLTPTSFDQHEHTKFLLDLQAVGKATGISYTGIQIAADPTAGGTAQQPTGLGLNKIIGVTINFTAKDYWTIRRFNDTLRTKFNYIMVPSSVTISHGAVGQTGQGNPYTCAMTVWMVLSPDATISGAQTTAASQQQGTTVQ